MTSRYTHKLSEKSPNTVKLLELICLDTLGRQNSLDLKKCPSTFYPDLFMFSIKFLNYSLLSQLVVNWPLEELNLKKILARLPMEFWFDRLCFPKLLEAVSHSLTRNSNPICAKVDLSSPRHCFDSINADVDSLKDSFNRILDSQLSKKVTLVIPCSSGLKHFQEIAASHRRSCNNLTIQLSDVVFKAAPVSDSAASETDMTLFAFSLEFPVVSCVFDFCYDGLDDRMTDTRILDCNVKAFRILSPKCREMSITVDYISFLSSCLADEVEFPKLEKLQLCGMEDRVLFQDVVKKIIRASPNLKRLELHFQSSEGSIIVLSMLSEFNVSLECLTLSHDYLLLHESRELARMINSVCLNVEMLRFDVNYGDIRDFHLHPLSHCSDLEKLKYLQVSVSYSNSSFNVDDLMVIVRFCLGLKSLKLLVFSNVYSLDSVCSLKLLHEYKDTFNTCHFEILLQFHLEED